MTWSERTEDEATLRSGLGSHPRLTASLDGDTVVVVTPMRPPATWRLREIGLLLAVLLLVAVTLFWIIFMIWSSWIMVAFGVVYAAFAVAAAMALAERALYRHRVTVSPNTLTVEALLFGRVVEKSTGGPVQFVETPEGGGRGEVLVYNEQGEFVVGSRLSHAERTWLTELLELAAKDREPLED